MIRLIGIVWLCLISVSPQDQRLQEFAWLSGCWESISGEDVVEEQWMRPLGGTMAGSGRFFSPGKRPFLEFLEILSTDSGTYFIARPGGRTGVPFKLVSSSAGSWTFENPLHDYPQRIFYSRLSADSMKTGIEGTVRGEIRREMFYHRRVPCR